MAKVRFTDEQRACVMRLSGPLDISAGAGSGKTFTLTQRIAQALADPESGVDDIDQICAITFTRKAAAELKGRVRSTLRAQGRLDQAMKVDSAWISTIHGACSRILRAEALELGVDPAFRVLEETERAELFSAALSEVLGAGPDIVEGAVRQSLAREYPVRSFFGESSIASMVGDLAERASAMPQGFDGFLRGPAPARPSSLALALLDAYRQVEPFYRECKESKTRDKALAELEGAVKALEAFVDSGSQDAADLVRVMQRCPLLSKIRSSNEARNEAFDDYQRTHSRIAQNVALCVGSTLLDELLDIARQVDRAFSRMKREAAALDSNDLVRLALQALDDPAIARRYESRFRLVMVDEFQDTDALQIAIVRHLAGPGMRYLCTVGDAQQSIYRFRGADVDGYKAFRRQLRSKEVAQQGGEPALLQLTRNFRSHGDVLAFVKKVCAQPCVFGEDFLDLSAAYDGAKYRAGEPRIRLDVTLVPAGKRQAGEAAAARATVARHVAQHFARMRDAGHDASEMVVLLGSMSNAEEYACALRQEGFECIVTGGSTFFTFPEVSVVRALADALVNPEDTTALFEVLTSDMFRLSADDLLELATGWDDAWGIPRNRKLNRGLAALADREPASAALLQAKEALLKAMRLVRFEGLACALDAALVDSGWIARLQRGGASGTAAVANILKAVRLVRSIEQGGAEGPSSAAQRFGTLFDSGAKDKPGVLNAGGRSAVRIMTIHASKGLEFPLVAVAELPSGGRSGGSLAMESRGGRTCVSLMPGAATLKKGGALAKAVDKHPAASPTGDPMTWEDACDAPDSAAFYAALRDIAEVQEAAEAQRLFYVAATRAKEALAVFLCVKERKDDPACKGVADDIRSAFFGHEAFSQEAGSLDFGGSEPAAYTCTVMGAEGSHDEGAASVAAGAGGQEDAHPDGESADAQAAERDADAAACAERFGSPGCATGTDAGSADAGASGDGDGAGGAIGEARAPIGSMSAPLVAPFALPQLRQAPHDDTGMFSYSSLSSAVAATQAGWKGSDGFQDGSQDEANGGARSSAAAKDGASSCSDEEELADASDDAGDQDDEGPSAKQRRALEKDANAATAFGSAFHRLAQMRALRGEDAAWDSFAGVFRSFELDDADRLRHALLRWLGSGVCKRAFGFRHCEPEYPFTLQMEQGCLEGEIDLLCFDEPCQGTALIVDYKTGGSADETAEHLEDKHRLQGQCYALAALGAGFSAVEVVFVRVEQDDPSGADTLQHVDYAYSAADQDALADLVNRLRAKTMEGVRATA